MKVKLILLFLTGVLLLILIPGCVNYGLWQKPQRYSKAPDGLLDESMNQDDGEFIDYEIIEHILRNLPQGSEILYPDNLPEKKYIKTDLDGDNRCEIIACYRNEKENVQHGIVIISDETWEKLWADDMRKEDNNPATLDRLVV
ncbi:MAG TPA: hypothetical protein PLH43_11255 [Acetivibrio sp.]|uniref:hypothetical protein n=1 Tax=Acetivibrio sp. TaxID=1872092 RepID=UPI002D103C7C|nr:hypothetical protein [Acetivibrio sp.]HOM03387.1 hypothetical protein [Acetivibrio sp.]